MKHTVNRVLVATLLAVTLTSCAMIEQNPRAAKGVGIGALGGAAAGAAIGAITGDPGQGAAIGAVVGAVGGGLVGAYLDKQADEMQAVLDEQDRLKREQEKLAVTMASDTLFESGKAQLQPGAQDKLGRLAQVMNRYPRSRIAIIGHTDSRGSEEANHELSVDRAQAVADALTENSVSAQRISVRGMGESRPLASNETAEGRAQNRRVEIDVTPEDRDATAAPSAEPH